MDPRRFCAQSRLVVVAGKGGVGKTTVTAAMARMAAGLGLSVLIVEVEGKTGLAAAFGAEDLEYEERELAPGIRARSLTPDVALVEYLEEHGLARISKRLVRGGLVEVVSTAAPGIKDILILGKVKQLERNGSADLILLDAPAAGHAVSFLMSPKGLGEVVRGGPLRAQADDVLEMLTDPARCRVMLVTLAEETPVNEVVETAFALEDRVGVDLGPVVVNGLYPVLAGLDVDPSASGVDLPPAEATALAAAAEFRARRQELQQEQLARLTAALPLPQLHLPTMFSVDLDPSDIDHLAAALASGVERLPARTEVSP
ncbi:MAG TPA: ArsA-related P-loop ATPase [Acidimicrobiales bacterium]|nr:ArsA-related P-loop ATPase [Acidimicrobiales bacterium]